MKQIPENSQDVKKLLYEQLALLIEKSKAAMDTQSLTALNAEIRQTALLLNNDF